MNIFNSSSSKTRKRDVLSNSVVNVEETGDSHAQPSSQISLDNDFEPDEYNSSQSLFPEYATTLCMHNLCSVKFGLFKARSRSYECFIVGEKVTKF